jgi:hypothetical protein
MQQRIKPPEEGLVWEWRAFGEIDRRLARKIQDRPIRLGILNQPEEDLYFVSPLSDQNVKLRSYASGSVLKVKLLFAVGPDAIELYKESETYVHHFPVSLGELEEAARLLKVQLGEKRFALGDLTTEEFEQALADSKPPVISVDVRKTRTQYLYDDGWIEMADVSFPQNDVQTLSIQSPDIEAVRRILKELRPGSELEVMNYIAACRRWKG